MGRVEGKKAFITGGAQGLGACFGRMLVDEGATVVLTDINFEAAKATAAKINETRQGSAMAIKHDVTNRDEWESALAQAADFMSGIDILINNAGIGTFGNIETESWEQWRRTQSIDVDSIFIGGDATAMLADRRRDRVYVARARPPELVIVDRRLSAVVRRIPLMGPVISLAQPIEGSVIYGASPELGGVIPIDVLSAEAGELIVCGQSPTSVAFVD